MRLALIALLAQSLIAATGKVVLLGTAIDSGSINGTNTSAKMFDGDYTTAWESTATGQWAGLDAGAAVTVTRYSITPLPDTAGLYWDRGLGLNVIEAANAADFSGAVTLDTLAAFPFLSQYRDNWRTIAPSTAYRYWRLRSPSGYGDGAELRLLANAQNGISAKPVEASISPWGGSVYGPTVTVTLSSLTTSASLYYTTDGTTPTTSSTLYSAPFSLSVSGGSTVTLKVLAYDASLSTPSGQVSTAYFRGYQLQAGDVNYDVTSGWRAETFGGRIIGPINGYWYRAGQWMLTANLSTTPGGGADISQIPGVWLWRARNPQGPYELVSQILDSNGGYTYIVRPHILYNSSTAKYVLWSYCTPSFYGTTHRACVAYADAIEGPWTWKPAFDPDSRGFKDCSVFQDDDGTAYVIYNYGSQTQIWVSKLASDYLTTVGQSLQLTSGGYEAGQMFRRGSTYFFIYGAQSQWGHTNIFTPYYLTSTSVLGTWSSATQVWTPSGYYNGQPAAIFKDPRFTDSYYLLLDWWDQPLHNGTTTVWVPLSFPTSSSLSFTAKAGTWTAHPGLFPLPGGAAR